jgi:hypothetical protein
VDANDAYGLLDEKYHEKDMVYEFFARNPGAASLDEGHRYEISCGKFWQLRQFWHGRARRATITL